MDNKATDAAKPTTGVRLIRAADRTPAGMQTPGMSREAAIETDTLWAGIARTAPGNQSGWHHHGEWTTVIYVLAGIARLECGPDGQTIVDAGPGDHLSIPPHEVHRESNPSEQDQILSVVRVGSGPVVVNVDAPDGAPTT